MKRTWSVPVRRRLPGWELALATTVTLACLAALDWSIGGLFAWSGVPRQDVPGVAPERVGYVLTQPPPSTPRAARPATAVSPRASVVASADAHTGAASDTGTAPRATGDVSPATVIVQPSTAARPTSAVHLAPSAFTFNAKYWSAQRESVLAAHGSRAPLLRWVMPDPTREELDSAARERSLQTEFARDASRPAAVPMGGSGISFPLFSRGPSREQRRRDSIILAENLRMLQRLQLRVQKRNDSIRYADSVMRRRATTLADSQLPRRSPTGTR